MREFFDSYSTKRHHEVVEFIQLRFELFTKRVNKKAMAYLQEKLVMTDKQALVRYFEIQKRCLIEQERSGYDEAYNTMHISKSQLLEKHHEYLESLQSGDQGETERVRVALIDMIYRYVYYKTIWYADLENEYYVEISDALLRQIEAEPDRFDMDLLCL